MTPGPGIEPGTHWWKASALTTAPALLPFMEFTNLRRIDEAVLQNSSSSRSFSETRDKFWERLRLGTRGIHVAFSTALSLGENYGETQ